MPPVSVHCDHAQRCGGCPVLDLPYDEQLALKERRVARAMERYPTLARVPRAAVLAAQPITGYRTRAKLVVGPDGSLGLFAKGGGHQVVDIPRCQVITAPLAQVAGALRERIQAARGLPSAFAAFDPSGSGALRAVDLREVRASEGGDAGVLVTLVVERARCPEASSLERSAQDLMRAVPIVLGVAVNFHDGAGPQILGKHTRPLAGAASAPDHAGASLHFATFGSFVQAHRAQAARIHALLADSLGVSRKAPPGRRAPRVLDLYGGSGSISLGLATAGAAITLVEEFAPAVAQFRDAARAQALPVEAICADVADALRTLNARAQPFDAAVVNPPRRGMSPAAREELAKLAPGLIAYVSCDPETLARDLAHFGRLGYAASSLQPLDMIPLSEEVETVAVILAGTVAAPAVLYEDDEVLVVDKSAHEPTVPQGEYRGSLLARVRTLPGAERAVAVQRLEVETSGPVLFVRTLDLLTKWQRLLASPPTRSSYIAAVRGITPLKGATHRKPREGADVAAARTRYRRIAVIAGHSVLRVVPDLGQKTPIRRQLANMGFPVLGDDRYGHAPTNRHFEEKSGLDRAFLHCARLEFVVPRASKPTIVESPLAGELRGVVERLGGIEALRIFDAKRAPGRAARTLHAGSDDGPEPSESAHAEERTR